MTRPPSIDFEEVARSFQEGLAAGQPPGKTLAKRYGITHMAARNRIRRARLAGLIPPHTGSYKKKSTGKVCDVCHQEIFDKYFVVVGATADHHVTAPFTICGPVCVRKISYRNLGTIVR